MLLAAHLRRAADSSAQHFHNHHGETHCRLWGSSCSCSPTRCARSNTVRAVGRARLTSPAFQKCALLRSTSAEIRDLMTRWNDRVRVLQRQEAPDSLIDERGAEKLGLILRRTETRHRSWKLDQSPPRYAWNRRKVLARQPMTPAIQARCHPEGSKTVPWLRYTSHTRFECRTPGTWTQPNSW